MRVHVIPSRICYIVTHEGWRALYPGELYVLPVYVLQSVWLSPFLRAALPAFH